MAISNISEDVVWTHLGHAAGNGILLRACSRPKTADWATRVA